VIIRSDSDLGALLTLMVLLGGFVGIVASAVLVVSRKFRSAAKVLLVSVTGLALYVAAVMLLSFLSPQTIVNIGDSYCMDIWCIGVERVNATPRGEETLYRVDVRIFSDANTVKTSAKGASVYLLDERGRRFELVNDPSVVPSDAPDSTSKSNLPQLVLP